MPNLSDISGSSALVEMLKEHIIEPMRNNAPGASKRVVIYGPPGTGKTFVAKAVAGELGLGFKRVNPFESAKDLKASAAYASRQTLVFFDELEWVNYRPLYMEALLGVSKDVLVVGATNYPWRVQNLLPEGFNNLIFMAEPDEESRKGILKYNLGVAAEKLDIARLAEMTPGYTASDIRYLTEWVAAQGQTTQIRLEAAISQYKTTQLNEWVAEAKANAGRMDRAAFEPLVGWLAQRP